MTGALSPCPTGTLAWPWQLMKDQAALSPCPPGTPLQVLPDHPRAGLWRRQAGAAILPLAAICCLGLWSGMARTQEPDIRIARLIKRLGDNSAANRDAALEELARLGAAARPQLVEAANHPDPEVRLRAKALLERLHVEELWQPTLVELPVGKLSPSRLLAQIAEQTGNRLLIGDQYGAFHETPVVLDEPVSSFWEAVDTLCRKSGNRVRQAFDSRQGGLVVVAGSLGQYPLAYAGPIRAQLVAARRVFTEELSYENQQSSQNHTFQFDLQFMWEDRFRLVAYRSQPEVLEAVTAGGQRLAAAQPAGGSWNVVSHGTRQVSMNLRLHPPQTSAGKLERLALRWGLIAVGQPASIEITDLANRRPYFQDDVELTVENFQQGPGSRCEVTILVVRDLVLPEPQEVLFHENDVELFDTQGRPYRKQGQTNALTEAGARMKLTYLGEASDSTPHLLRFTYPRIRAQRGIEIQFTDVPLPTGRPE